MKKLLLLSLLITQQSFADDLLMSNVPNGCSVDLKPHTYLRATFEPNQYQCNSGDYLPANTDHCVACPEYYDCNGGNFTFNETYTQGAKFKTFITSDIKNGCRTDFTKSINNTANISPVFTPNQHTCTPGYYLPANADSCTICPQNNYCIGGTYTFNETSDQGIEQCVNGHAPIGSSVCYPHILHIGNDVVYLKSNKLTTPSLNIGMDDGIFYANMTTTPTPMNAATEHFLKIEYDGTIYYVCDDTTFNK